MGGFPCCSPNHSQDSIHNKPGMGNQNQQYYNQPGMVGNDKVMGPGIGPGQNMVTPGAVPPRQGIGRFGPY